MLSLFDSTLVILLFIIFFSFYLLICCPNIGSGADLVYSQSPPTLKLILLFCLSIPGVSLFIFFLFYLNGSSVQKITSTCNDINSSYRKMINLINKYLFKSEFTTLFIIVGLICLNQLIIYDFMSMATIYLRKNIHAYFYEFDDFYNISYLTISLFLSPDTTIFGIFELFISLFISFLNYHGLYIESMDKLFIPQLLIVLCAIISMILVMKGNDYIHQKISISFRREEKYSFIFWSLWLFAFPPMLYVTFIVGVLLKIKGSMSVKKIMNPIYSKIVSPLTLYKILKLLIKNTKDGAINKAIIDAKVLIDSVNQHITSTNVTSSIVPVYKSAIYYQIQSIIEEKASLNYFGRTFCAGRLFEYKIRTDMNMGMYGGTIVILGLLVFGFPFVNATQNIIEKYSYVLNYEYKIDSITNRIIEFSFILGFCFGSLVGLYLGKKVYVIINDYYSAFYNTINNERNNVINADRALIQNYNWNNDTYGKEFIVPILTNICGENTAPLVSTYGSSLLQNTDLLSNSYESTFIKNSV